MSYDLRDDLFAVLKDQLFVAELRVTTPGVVCGVEDAASKALDAGCEVLSAALDADECLPEQPVLVVRGPAKAIAIAEDTLPGAIAKFTAIARAARQAQAAAGDRVQVVSGAAKKMPMEIKPQVRRAIHIGGGSGRITAAPFVYIDKNYVRIFNGVRNAVTAASTLAGHTRCVQLRGLVEPFEDEARAAIEMGVEILMVDTGRIADLDLVAQMVRAAGRRDLVRIAFAGDIGLEDIAEISTHDVDILDIGRAVIDAPIVDVKFDVVHHNSAADPRPSRSIH
jgi:nicotinate-nucleotide pyrophosphorylase (carboxylating)